MIIQIQNSGLQPKQIQHIVNCIKNGGIIIYPTDTIYGIGTGLSNIRSLERIAKLKLKKKDDLKFTLLCKDLSQMSQYCRPISNNLFKFIKSHIPGPFTFIMEANNTVHKYFQSNKKEVGIRIINNDNLLQIIEALGEPLLNTSLDDTGENVDYITDPEYIHKHLGKQVDLVIDGGIGKVEYSTILDCTKEEISIIRQGIGEI